ncbi:MAG: carboxypeptidase-like regulatory domain-containing protein [Bacteroidetes bacterium]|nr:carboxypeptidase-like regulatory domain-containing protein [Bacteroidota bacterium]
MRKKIYTAILVALTTGTAALAQSGALKGRVIDAANSEGVSFANVQLEQGGSAIAKTVADIDGNFTIKPITPGKYDLKAAAVGFQPLLMTGVLIGGDRTTYQDLKVKSSAVELGPVEIIEYEKPLIKADNVQGKDITRAEFEAMPSKNINTVAATAAGVAQEDDNRSLNIRGARADGTSYYIDGVRAVGSLGMPQSGVEQISVITGGLPAQYGDATGGVINITTRGGVRPNYYGGVQLISSQLTDKYGYNFADFNVGGPLMFKKDSSGNKNPKLGFFLSGQVSTEKDPNPSAIGHYKVNADKLAEIEQHPLQLSADGSGLIPKADFVTMNDIQHIKAAQNTRSNNATFSGKIDYKPSDRITLTVGGSMNYVNARAFVYEYSLFNPSHNPQVISNNMRMYGKITHKLGRQKSKDEKSSAFITNAYYSLQVSYNSFKQSMQDVDHKKNFFDYAYVGKFKSVRSRSYVAVRDSVTGVVNSYSQNTWKSDSVEFTPGTLNPLAVNYTTDYYNLMGAPSSLSEMQNPIGGGLLNGDRPPSPYALFYGTGRSYGGYNTSQSSQLRVTGTFSADIKNNAIQAGFEYEKRTERAWSITTSGGTPLWQLARQLVNKHLTQLDSSVSTPYTGTGPIWTGTSSIYTSAPVYMHPYVTNSSAESQFGKEIRKELVIADNEWVDVDNLDPSQLSINMFSPDELINSGSSLVGYNGYSIYGKKLTGSKFDMAALESYYKDKDENGNYTRTIPAFQPVYVAGYIQDKFDIKDMKFNIGLRVDAFNSNQPVLKDMYLLNEAYTVAEATQFTHPANVGADYVVYVDDAKNPTKVVGYRHGGTWYNSQGIIIIDPKDITRLTNSGTIQPMLKYPNEKFLDSSKVSNVFKMYQTQINLNPRISFTFPITKDINGAPMASFFAHYDVLTQRAPVGPFSPLSFKNGTGANYDLKASRTVDYEVGFNQVLNDRKNSSLTLSAFYRQMKDMLQMINVFEAYPLTYSTFGNVDFGNVKGFSISYDLRRTQNSQLSASYTLQFAEGTGSSATSNAGAVAAAASGQPNLRSTYPLDFDQRHAIVLNYDYRFGSGKDYRGPQAKWAKIFFENLGGNVIFRTNSGLPYSRRANVVSEVLMGLNQPSSLSGNINGSNLPWQYHMDLRIDKNMQLKWGKGTGEKVKKSNITVYLQILNVLNTQNVLNVYRYTGDPKDDGYLSSPNNQNEINGKYNAQAFIDQYNVKLASPGNYSLPRRMRIGVIMNF